MKERSPIKRSVFLLFLGALDAAYLLYHHVSVVGGYQMQPSVCNLGGTFDCDKVAESAWSEVFGIPVASLGLLYYLGFLLLIWLFHPKDSGPEASSKKEQYQDALFVFSIFSVPVSLWFLYISIFALSYVCLFCSLLYLVNLLLCFVLWWHRVGKASLRERIVRGVLFGISSLFPVSSGLKNRAEYAAVASFWVLMLVFGSFLYATPAALTKYVFEPRERALRSPEFLNGYYVRWKRQEKVEIALRGEEAGFGRDYWLGSDDAVLTVFDFSDFQCPFCKRTERVLRSAVERSQGQIRVVFKNFPLDSACNPRSSLHQFSCQAAAMARCAGRQGVEGFWEMHDALFELTYLEWDVERLFKLPEDLGFDSVSFDRCLQGKRAIQRVEADIELGNELGINSTPTIFVDGRKMTLGGNFRLEHIPGFLELVLKKKLGVEHSAQRFD